MKKDKVFTDAIGSISKKLKLMNLLLRAIAVFLGVIMFFIMISFLKEISPIIFGF